MFNSLKNIQKASTNLTNISPTSPKFYLLLFPPVYIFWSIGLINIVFKKGKDLMTYFALIMSLFALLLIGFYSFGLLQQSLFIKTTEFKMFLSIYMIVWVVFWFFVSYKSLKFESEFEISEPNSLDYFVRFFVLTNWYIGVWSFQSIVREYNRIYNKPKY